MKIIFRVHGPLVIPFYQGKGGRTITDDNVKQFWKQNASVARLRGCYVFAVRAAKGWKPAYVGKATKSFKQEAFSSHKLSRYQQFLADYLKGTPVMFLIIAPSKKGALNRSYVSELEEFLIQVGVSANPALLNIQGTKQEEWGIAGVLRGGKGKTTMAASQFRQLMKIKH